MSLALAEQDIVQCRRGTPALDGSTLAALLRELPQWSVVNVEGIDQLQRSFTFPDFAAALTFTNAVGALAEAADHHPTLITEWGKVKVQWWTHTVRGLHRNDFVMAARCDRLCSATAEK